MANQPQAAKSDYREVIRKRAEKLIRDIADIDQGDLDRALDRVIETLRVTALESWRNGIEAGMKRARQPRPDQRPSAGQPQRPLTRQSARPASR